MSKMMATDDQFETVSAFPTVTQTTGVALCGVVLCGVALCGAVLCGVVLCGVWHCVGH